MLSRVADSLFWMSRYIERSENNARIADVNLQLLLDLDNTHNTAEILDVKYHLLLPSGERVGGNIDTVQWMSVLKSCSALEAYRKVYVGQVAPWKVAAFLITHPHFPRSIRFSVESLDAALHRISGSPETHYANEAERLSGRLPYDLDFATIGHIFDYGLHEYLILTQRRLAEISRALFEIYCATNETISPPSIAEGRTA